MDEDDDYAYGLRGGHWRPHGGIVRWVAEEPEEPPAKKPVVCGTERSYQRHRHLWRRHGLGTWPLPADDPCGCRAAHRAHVAFRKAMKERDEEREAA